MFNLIDFVMMQKKEKNDCYFDRTLTFDYFRTIGAAVSKSQNIAAMYGFEKGELGSGELTRSKWNDNFSVAILNLNVVYLKKYQDYLLYAANLQKHKKTIEKEA